MLRKALASAGAFCYFGLMHLSLDILSNMLFMDASTFGDDMSRVQIWTHYPIEAVWKNDVYERVQLRNWTPVAV